MRKLAVVMMLFAACASAPPRDDVRITILHAGRFSSEDPVVLYTETPGPLARPTAPLHMPRFIEETDTVPAHIMATFGYVFTADAAGDAPLNLTIRLRHPRTVNATTGRSSNEDVWHVHPKPGQERAAIVRLDRPADLQPGDWTFTVEDGSRVLASRTFHLH